MLGRLAGVIGVLALLFDAVGANGLRSSVSEVPEEANVPTDNAKAQIFVKKLMGAAKAKAGKDIKEMKDHMDKLKTNHNANEDAMLAAKAAHSRKKTETLTTTAAIRSTDLRWGSFVKRHRPNGDCSGTPNLITAHQFDGSCVDDGNGNFHDFTCAHVNEDGVVALNRNWYSYSTGSTGPCQGQPYYSSQEYDRHGLKCMMDSAYSTGVTMPQTISHQCSKKSAWDFVREGGVVTYGYGFDSQCGNDNAMSSISMQPFQGCELVVEYLDAQGNEVNSPDPNGTSTYVYVSMKSCTQDGWVSVVGYADPACRRPLFKGKAEVLYGNNMCVFDTDLGQYGRTMCVPTSTM